MEIKNKKQILSISLSVLASVFLVSCVVCAVTTIGTDIDTAGNLTVDGNATTSGNLIVGTSSWPAPTSTLTVAGTAYINGNATTSGNFVIGTSLWAAPTSTLTVVGTAYINDNATTSSSLWIGASGTANNINLGGGDLYVENDAEIDNNLYVTGTASSTNSIVSGAATTTGNLVIGYNNQADGVTTTVTFGSYDSTATAGEASGVCLKIRQDNTWVYCYVNDTAFLCGATSCE